MNVHSSKNSQIHVLSRFLPHYDSIHYTNFYIVNHPQLFSVLSRREPHLISASQGEEEKEGTETREWRSWYLFTSMQRLTGSKVGFFATFVHRLHRWERMCQPISNPWTTCDESRLKTRDIANRLAARAMLSGRGVILRRDWDRDGETRDDRVSFRLRRISQLKKKEIMFMLKSLRDLDRCWPGCRYPGPSTNRA